MKDIFTLLSFILLFSLNETHAQINFGSEGTFSNKWHEGTLVFKNKDTLVGLVKFDDVSDDLTGFALSNKVKFKSSENAKKQKFKKKTIDYFEVNNNSEKKVKYIYLTVKVEGLKLVRVEVEGKINIYTDDYSYWTQDPMIYHKGKKIYATKENKKTIDYLFMANAFSSFKKKAIRYFEDCSELITKLENNEYTRKDYLKIAEDYNSCF
jgi:hypothetical protein